MRTTMGQVQQTALALLLKHYSLEIDLEKVVNMFQLTHPHLIMCTDVMAELESDDKQHGGQATAVLGLTVYYMYDKMATRGTTHVTCAQIITETVMVCKSVCVCVS